jgi:hypothetical protein
MFSQQYRWAMGSISLFSNWDFWVSNLTIKQKLCYLSGMAYYVATGIGCLLNPLPAILVIAFSPEHVHFYSIAASVPSFLYATVAIGIWSKAPWGFYSMKTRALQSWAHLCAIEDKVKGDLAQWVPSGVSLRPSDRFVKYRLIALTYSAILPAIFLAFAYPELQKGRYEVLFSLSFLALNCVVTWLAFKTEPNQ